MLSQQFGEASESRRISAISSALEEFIKYFQKLINLQFRQFPFEIYSLNKLSLMQSIIFYHFLHFLEILYLLINLMTTSLKKRISSINLIKSVVSCGYRLIYWRILDGKLPFLCSTTFISLITKKNSSLKLTRRIFK